MEGEAAIRVRERNTGTASTTAGAKWPFLLQLVAAGSHLCSSLHLLFLTSMPPTSASGCSGSKEMALQREDWAGFTSNALCLCFRHHAGLPSPNLRQGCASNSPGATCHNPGTALTSGDLSAQPFLPPCQHC